jgi:hypothetical protein
MLQFEIKGGLWGCYFFASRYSGIVLQICRASPVEPTYLNTQECHMLKIKSNVEVVQTPEVQCFTVSALPIQVMGFGTAGGISPAVVRHIHESNKEGAMIVELEPQVFGTGGISPAVVKHFITKVN